MAMPALDAHYWTAAEVRALPDDGKRYECVDGELLVTPSPRLSHQRMLEELKAQLREFVKHSRCGELLASPADIELEPGSLVQPDIFVALPRDGTRLRDWADVGSLLLAIEILSPSTARNDRVVKRRFYQRAGVAEYWIVDLDARVIERWTPSQERPDVIAGGLEWTPVTGGSALRIDLERLFAAVLN